MQEVMDKRPKVLLADDDPDLLDLYRETLARLPSQPEIHKASYIISQFFPPKIKRKRM